MKALPLFFRLALIITLLAPPPSNTHAAQIPPVPDATLSLLKDIATANQSAVPAFLYGFENTNHPVFLFAGSEDTNSGKLYRSDGTAAGTSVLLDQSPSWGVYGLGGKAYFVPYKPGSQLYVTDGTPGGTKPVYDFNADYIYVTNAAAVGSWLYLALSNDGQNELWRTDGTSGGTTRVVDNLSINAPWADYPQMAILNNALYITASDGQTGYELWRIPSDNSAPVRVKDICPGNCGVGNWSDSNPRSLTVAGNTLYFIAYGLGANNLPMGGELWATDGSPTNTRLVKEIRPGEDGAFSEAFEYLAALGSTLYFTANDGVSGVELWRTDGAAAGTQMVKDIYPGPVSSRPRWLTPLNGALYFSASDGSHGMELWKTGSGVSGAQMIEIAPGAEDGLPAYFAELDGTLYFSAQSVPGNLELWMLVNGVPAQVADIVPVPDGSSPQYLRAWNHHLVFTAADSVHGRELWASGGSAATTSLIVDLNTQPGEGSRPHDFRTFGGITYFIAEDILHGTELWRTNGTPDSTWLVRDIIPGPTGTEINTSDMAELNGIVYFTASDTTSYVIPHAEETREHGSELWRTDGTRQGTWMVKDLIPGTDSSFPNHYIVMGNTLYFFASDSPSHGSVLWKSDGTALGTQPVNTQYTVNPNQLEVAVINNALIFATIDSYHHNVSFFHSDGTDAGTELYSGGATGNRWAFMQAFNGRMYLGLDEGSSGSDIVITDGTYAGTIGLRYEGNAGTQLPSGMIPLSDSLYFISPTYIETYQGFIPVMWKLPARSNTAERVMDLPSALTIEAITSFSDTQFLFRVRYGDGTGYWYRSDGTQEGTDVICHTCAFSAGEEYALWQNLLAFTGDSGAGQEIWLTDGGEAGTFRLADAVPGVNISAPNNLSAGGINLFFSADDSQHNQEPWVYRIALREKVYLPVTMK